MDGHRRTDAALGAALVVLWSSGFVGSVLGTRSATATTLLSWRFLVAAAVLGLVAVVRRPRVARGALGRHAVLGLLIQSVAWTVALASFGGYGTYLLVLRRGGALRASTLLYLTPPVTALWAWAMFGQAPGPLAVPGTICAAAGAALVLVPAQVIRCRPRTPPGPCPRR